MLIITRRTGELTRIGDNMSVRVLGVKGNQVRLGFEAPKDVTILREEVYERDQQSDATAPDGAKSES